MVLLLSLSMQVFKFRAANESEGRRWLDGLNAWREYFLLNM